jgi:hypothetical protein
MSQKGIEPLAGRIGFDDELQRLIGEMRSAEFGVRNGGSSVGFLFA